LVRHGAGHARLRLRAQGFDRRRPRAAGGRAARCHHFLTTGRRQPWPHAVRVRTDWRTAMLSYAVIFLVIALIAGVLGFSGIAGAASNIAWILFLVFLVLAAISFFRGRRV